MFAVSHSSVNECRALCWKIGDANHTSIVIYSLFLIEKLLLEIYSIKNWQLAFDDFYSCYYFSWYPKEQLAILSYIWFTFNKAKNPKSD